MRSCDKGREFARHREDGSHAAAGCSADDARAGVPRLRASRIGEDIERLREAAALIREINMGATAIGTGINTDPRYAPLVCEKLSR